MNVANPMIRYASLGCTLIPPIAQLDPLSRAKFILQQSIFVAFTRVICDSDHTHGKPISTGPMLDEYQKHIEHLTISYRSPDVALSEGDRELYNLMLEQALNILDGPDAMATKVSLGSLEGALHYPTPCTAVNTEYILGTPEAYLPVFHAIGITIPNDRLTDGLIPNAQLLSPSIIKGPGINDSLTIQFKIHTVSDYSPFLFEENHGKVPVGSSPQLFAYLFRFNLSACNLDDLVAILSNYAMEVVPFASHTINNLTPVLTLPQVCWYILTKLDTRVPGELAGTSGVQLLDIIAFLLINHRIGVSSDTSTIGRVLSCCNLPDGVDVSRYLTKPATEITATEALSFKRSRLSQIFPDRVLAMMVKEDATTEEGQVPPGDDSTADELGQDNEFIPEGADAGGDAPTDEPDPLDKPGEPIQPGEDPARMAKIANMVFELATNNESLADFLFKQAVLSRIRDVIANPPVKLPTDELLFLKRWASSYINLVNIKTIKSFMACLSFKLMDLRLATDTPIGD